MKVYQKLQHEMIMATFAVIGNAVEIAKQLDAVGAEAAGKDLLGIAEYYTQQLTQEAVEPPVGPGAFFNGPNERLHFGQYKGRCGYDTKTTAKILREGIKKGILGFEGKNRSKVYFLKPVEAVQEPVTV